MRHRTSDRPTRPPTASAAALLACLIALGCGSGESPAPEPAAPPATAMEEPNVPAPPAAEMPAAPGETEPAPDVTSSEGVIPEGYPSDVPVYPGSAPGPAMSMPGLGVFATFESDDSVEAIIAHFRGELTNKGWAVADAADGGLDATKEGREVQVRARENEAGRSEIAVNVSGS